LVDLAGLPYATGARFQDEKKCLPGTRQGIQSIIINWVDSHSPRDKHIFVLTGASGSGKSAIAHSIAAHYKELGRLGSSIFANQVPKETLHAATGIPVLLFPTIARDLADLDSQYQHMLWTKIGSDRALRETLGIGDQYKNFILGPLTSGSLAISGPIVIVLDGLDEWEHSAGLKTFLTVLAGQAHHLPANFRFLLIARNDSTILQNFEGNPIATIYSMEDIDEWCTKCDLVQVAKARLHIVASLTAEQLEAMVLELAERANGSFEWIIDTCKAILSSRKDQQNPSGIE
jgi:hypothetical protein